MLREIADYKILNEIGKGKFSRVYQAEHKILGKMVSVKINNESTREFFDMLKSEARILWDLDDYHSIPSIKGFQKIDTNKGAIIMKHIEGSTLDDLIRLNGRLENEDVAWITERLLGALHYAHYNGVIHSDVKPQNVFVEIKKHDIKLIDWGLSSIRPNEFTLPNGYTPRYAAPELFSNSPPLPESDLYGAGLTMLYALGGDVQKRSFRDDTPRELKIFVNSLIKYFPKDRPNWETNNPIERLSEIRYQLFGRRHMESNSIKLKGGDL